MQAIAILIKPHIIPKLCVLKRDDQRLDSSRRVENGGKERIGWNNVLPTRDGGLGLLHEEIDVSAINRGEWICVVVVIEPAHVNVGNLKIGKSKDLPNRDLHFAVVVLASKLGIAGEILSKQPIQLIDLGLG